LASRRYVRRNRRRQALGYGNQSDFADFKKQVNAAYGVS
jgi:hypothetical protein